MPGFEIIGEEERKEVNSVFDKDGMLYRYGKNASKVKDFEAAFAKMLSVKHAHAVTSGTAALHCAMVALGIGPGDEVITSSYTFVATAEAIMACGAKPVFTEIDETLDMDPEDIEHRITPKTKAIIPVHMHGSACNMDKIMKIAKKHGLFVVEDACQATGGTYKGKMLGAIGDIGTFSFDYGKNITTGEGGMVVSNNDGLAAKAFWFTDHGHHNDPKFSRATDTRSTWGMNYRMDELHGAVGLPQLRKLDLILRTQRNNKAKLRDMLSEIKGMEFRKHNDAEGEIGDYLVFYLASEKKARAVLEALLKIGVETKNLPSAIEWHFAGMWDHMLPQISDDYKNLKVLWKKSRALLNRAIAIGISLKMTEDQMQKITAAVETATKM